MRIALLEADVALPVVKDLIAAIREKAVGQEVLRSITPGQMVVKIVHDHLIEVLGGKPAEGAATTGAPLGSPLGSLGAEGFTVRGAAPAVVLMVGLQGSGKTTTTAKIARRLTLKDKQKVLMASLDVARPAAQEQLAVLGRQVSVETLPIVPGQPPVEIAKRALTEARRGGFDVLMLDTAGRLSIDEALMAEVAAVRDATSPVQTLLVADAMTGQDAVTTAQHFNDRVGLTGIVLTRIDGDARGGAALSMRGVTGKPIVLLGVGEKMDALEDFHADRIAGRILGMGDVVSLVEKAAQTIDQEAAEKLAARMQKGEFDLEDFLSQLRQVKKMGGMSGLMGLMPGIQKIKKQLDESKIDDGVLKRQEAIILSMTPKERRNWKLLNARRKQRIAAGSGTSVQDVNRLLKQFQDMQSMMKKMQALGKSGLAKQLAGKIGGLGSLPGILGRR